jgi:membrane protein YdbS with pleckstrin-like domain
MQCVACGNDIQAGASQCPSCGHWETSMDNKQDSKQPLAVLKPVLIVWLVIARYLITQINLAIVGGVFGGLLVFAYELYIGIVDLRWEPFVYFGLFFFFAVPITTIFIHKRTYDLTRYVFYPEHLEYYEGFWNIERKIIHYKAITEVELKQTVIQRLYHLGSIHVIVPAMGGKHTGIVIADIKNYEKAYHFLQKAVRGAIHG